MHRVVAVTCATCYVLFFVEADTWFAANWPDLAPRPVLLFLGFAAFVAVTRTPADLRAPASSGAYPVLLALACLAALSVAGALHPTAYAGDDLKYWLLPSLNVVAVAVGAWLAGSETFSDRRRRLHLVAWAVLTGSILADILEPGLLANHPSRAAGFPRNPGAAAFLLAVACGMAFRRPPPQLRALLLIVPTGMAVLATLSRSGIVQVALTTILPTLYSAVPFGSVIRRLRTGFVVLGVLAAFSVAMLRSPIGLFERTTAQRRLGALVEGQWLGVDDSRSAIFARYGRLVASSPWLGHGSGYSQAEGHGTHNVALQEWVEGGVPRLLTYLTFVSLAVLHFVRRRHWRGLWLMSLIVFQGLFAHRVLEHRGVAMALGLLLASDDTQR